MLTKLTVELEYNTVEKLMGDVMKEDADMLYSNMRRGCDESARWLEHLEAVLEFYDFEWTPVATDTRETEETPFPECVGSADVVYPEDTVV